MTTLLDGDRLRAFLESQLETLAQEARSRHLAEGENDPTALRMDGGVANMQVVLNQLRNFEHHPGKRTPIKDISKDATSKVRRHDPGTSFEAALSQTPEKSRALYTVIHGVLARKPMTDEELFGLFESRGKAVTPSGVRSRRSELVEAGWVRDSGQKRPTVSGHPSIVWEAVPES